MRSIRESPLPAVRVLKNGWPPLLLLLVLWHSCEAVFQNYDGHRDPGQTAVITGNASRLYLIGARRKLYDRLVLDPGDYMIGFRQSSNHMSGAARCQVAAGQHYQIAVTGRTFLKQSRTWSLTGECRVLLPEESSFPNWRFFILE